MTIDFLNVVQAAHKSFFPDDALDSLIVPSQRGQRRLAGVDLKNPRMRTVCDAVLALAPKPAGFTITDLTNKIHEMYPDTAEKYSPRQAAYDLMKFRGKQLVMLSIERP